MLSQLVEFITRFFEYFLPFTIVPPWAAGPVIRLGKVVGVAGPGICWHWPFNITKVAHVATVTQTIRPAAQTVTTGDGKSIVAAIVIRFNVSDPKVFVVDVFDAKSAIDDIAAGTLRLLVNTHTWEELQDIDLDNELTKKTRAELKKFGIHVEAATLADFGQIKSLRLLLDKKEDTPTLLLS